MLAWGDRTSSKGIKRTVGHICLPVIVGHLLLKLLFFYKQMSTNAYVFT